MGEDWGENGYMFMKIIDGDGICGINMEVSFPNIYLMSVPIVISLLAISIVAIMISIWPLFKLSWCKRQDLLFLHDG